MTCRTREEYLDVHVSELEREVSRLRRDRLLDAMVRAERWCLALGVGAIVAAGVQVALLLAW